MIVRPPQAADFEPVRALLDGAGLPTADLVVTHIAFVADEGGAPVGAIGLEHFGDCGLLRSLVVAPSARSGGIGRKLVAALEQHAQALGETELWLLTIDADGYFAGHGYALRRRDEAPASIRKTAEFSGLCPGHAVLMSKRL